jgi:hypothetical protein
VESDPGRRAEFDPAASAVADRAALPKLRKKRRRDHEEGCVVTLVTAFVTSPRAQQMRAVRASSLWGH